MSDSTLPNLSYCPTEFGPANHHKWVWTGDITGRGWVCQECDYSMQNFTNHPETIHLSVTCDEYKIRRVHED